MRPTHPVPSAPARRHRSRTAFALLLAAIVVGGVVWLLKKDGSTRYSEPAVPARYVPELPATGVPEVDEELRRSQADMRTREAILRRAELEERDARMRLELEKQLKDALDRQKAAVDGAYPSSSPSGMAAPK